MIEKNGQVRLKIVGLKHQATQIVSQAGQDANFNCYPRFPFDFLFLIAPALFFSVHLDHLLECRWYDKGGLLGTDPINWATQRLMYYCIHIVHMLLFVVPVLRITSVHLQFRKLLLLWHAKGRVVLDELCADELAHPIHHTIHRF